MIRNVSNLCKFHDSFLVHWIKVLFHNYVINKYISIFLKFNELYICATHNNIAPQTVTLRHSFFFQCRQKINLLQYKYLIFCLTRIIYYLRHENEFVEKYKCIEDNIFYDQDFRELANYRF